MSVIIQEIEYWNDWPRANDTAFDVVAISNHTWVTAEGDLVGAGEPRVVGVGTITALRPTIPQITLPSTSAGFDNQSARWTVSLHRTGKPDAIFTVCDSFALPISFEPSTTWGEIRLYKQSNNNYVYRDNGGFNRTDTLALINSRVDAQVIATNIQPGKVRLATAADNPLDPVVVEDNDPRLVSTINKGAALEFPGTGGARVNHGVFWREDQDLGTSFYWEAWVCPLGNSGAGYIVAAGFGGAHEILFGMQTDGTGRDVLTGNVATNGITPVSFGSDDGLAPGEWGHVALAWDSVNLIASINGVPSGSVPFAGPRVGVQHSNGGGGTLYIGGSDHNNFHGRISQVRGYDNSNGGSSQVPALAGSPETIFTASSDVDFLADFTSPARIIPDLSPRGYPTGMGASLTAVLTGSAVSSITVNDGGKHYRPGTEIYFEGGVPFGSLGGARAEAVITDGVITSVTILSGGANYTTPPLVKVAPPRGYNHPGTLQSNSVSSPVPQWVLDVDCPTYDTSIPTVTPDGLIDTPSTPPTGAVVFDSFSRKNSTYAFGGVPSIGSTESGSMGPQVWVTGTPGIGQPSVWGILNGRAWSSPFPFIGVAYVPTGISNQDVRVTRRTGNYGGGETGIAFRVQDADNFLYAYVTIIPFMSQHVIKVAQMVAGVSAEIGSFAQPVGSWSVLRVTANGTAINVYCDATNIGNLTSSQFQTQTKAGIVCRGYNGGTDSSALARYDNFTVLPA